MSREAGIWIRVSTKEQARGESPPTTRQGQWFMEAAIKYGIYEQA